jgi:hypothetical protein
VFLTPTLGFGAGSSVVVSGTTYANGRQPWFVGTATAGATIDLIVSGTGIIRSKVVGTVVADASGNFRFQLPAGLKNGSFVVTARAHGMYGSADLVSSPLSFKIGPVPHVKAKPQPKPKGKTPALKAHKSATPARTVIRVQHHAVKTTAVSNGHVVDQAVHALAQNPLLFKNKKKGH